MDINSFSNIVNPVFSSDSGNLINFTCDIEGVGNGVSFTASDTDPEEYGHQLYVNAVNGVYGPVSPFVESVQSEEEILSNNKIKQAHLLEFAAQVAFPLQSAVDLNSATSEQQNRLIKIKKYSVQVLNIDLSNPEIVWPVLKVNGE